MKKLAITTAAALWALAAIYIREAAAEVRR